jgi:uncharacterized protein YbjT (DUF2867 family)
VRVFLAGASGAIGRQLVPLLIADGHEVAGTTRSEAKVEMLRELGAKPVVSIAWQLPGEGGAAVAEHERMVLEAGGVVARYGRFHGPGTYHEQDRPKPPHVHVAEAARRSVELLEAPSGIVEVIES